MQKDRPKICFITSVPITLWAFYRGLIEILEKDYADITIVTSQQPELEWLKKEFKVSIVPIELPRRIAPFQDLVSLCKLWRLLCNQKFDLVHAHTPKAAFIGIIASFLARVPKRIYTIHGSLLTTATGFKRCLLWTIEWLTCKFATNILVVSPSLLKRIVEEKLSSKDKMTVLGKGSACGIDLLYFNRTDRFDIFRKQIREKYNIKLNAIVFGFVGRIVPDKGIKILVEAFENLQKIKSDSILFLVGEFEKIRDSLDEGTLKKINSNANIRCNREWISDVLPFYAALDIIVLPTKHEGFGLTLIEAAALGIPTIASKVTGCVDAVVDGVTGLLVEVDNSQELLNAMLKLSNDEPLRKRLGNQGKQRVIESFDSKILIRDHIEYYKKLNFNIWE